jgi:integrase
MVTRRRRAGVEDRWTKADGTESANHGTGKRWRARYVDDRGREHAKGFDRKVDAQRWLDQQTAAVVDGRHVAPRDAQITVREWCQTWLEGYQGNRRNSIVGATRCVTVIIEEFGDMPLSALLPSHVKTWVAKLQAQGYANSTVHTFHGKLAQICSDAVHDNLLGRNPCSRRTSPPMGKKKLYVASTEQVWALHDATAEHMKAAVLLGAFGGLRVGEAAGLRISDVDFMRGIVHPVQQAGGAPLKTPGSSQPIPIPREMALALSASVAKFGGEYVVTNGNGGPSDRWRIADAIRDARGAVEGLPDGFSFHDLRHFFASLLIASGADIKTIQARLRHATAAMTLDTYGHLWPDADESTRAVVGKVFAERMAQ